MYSSAQAAREVTGTRLEYSGHSDAHGRARLRGTATTSGRWLLQYFGDAKHFDSYGKAAAVTVR